MKNLILSGMIGMIAIIIIFTIGIYFYYKLYDIKPQKQLRKANRQIKMQKRIQYRRAEEQRKVQQKKGYGIFHNFGCSGCPAIDDDTVLLGPSLKSVAYTLTRSALKKALTATHTYNLTLEELNALIGYMKACKS